MASYIKNSLIKDEKVLYEGRQSYMTLVMPSIFFVLLLWTVFLALIPLAVIISRLIMIHTTEIAITNKRVIAKFGLISRTTIETRIEKIETIQVKQGVIGRMFNYGSLIVSGAGTPQAPVPGISSPLDFRRRFNEIQEELEDSK